MGEDNKIVVILFLMILVGLGGLGVFEAIEIRSRQSLAAACIASSRPAEDCAKILGGGK